MKILVTGATGFIGSHLVDYLHKSAVPIRVFSRKSREKMAAHWGNAVETFHGDILDREAVERALDGIDTVYHLAAELRMGLMTKEVLQKTNIQGSRNIIEVCREKKIDRLIFCSSVGVLGDVGHETADETFKPNPDDDYELSKYQAECLAIEASRDLQVVIIRPAWVYGPRDTRTLKLFKTIASGRMFLLGSAQNKIHPVFVSDVVQALVKAGRVNVESGALFHIAGPTVVTVRSLLETAAQMLETRLIPVRFPLSWAKLIATVAEPSFKWFGKEAPLTRGKIGFFVKNRVYSIQKARNILGFDPAVELDEGLKLTFQWYKKNNML